MAYMEFHSRAAYMVALCALYRTKYGQISTFPLLHIVQNPLSSGFKPEMKINHKLPARGIMLWADFLNILFFW